ncbi:uncharacterized protein LOC133801521 [Humulus lupulus]|uniref:uncharacterized protein LOC133801521 n=1 Tax=Humulus lupulus TaxID=3486 RepID=UPI002B411C7D|nr:uncharacterized protein LOC133801521 [Humulus lupulus]
MGYILAKEKQCCQGLESSVCSKGLLWICVKEYSNSLHFMGLKAGTKKQKYDKISEKKMLTPIEQPSGKPVLNPGPSAKRIERPSGSRLSLLNRSCWSTPHRWSTLSIPLSCWSMLVRVTAVRVMVLCLPHTSHISISSAGRKNPGKNISVRYFLWRFQFSIT